MIAVDFIHGDYWNVNVARLMTQCAFIGDPQTPLLA